VAASGTASSSTTTGALVVGGTGGLGVGGSAYVGGTVFAANSAIGFFSSVNNTPIGTLTPSTAAFTTATTSGTFTASGNIVAASSTASTNTTSGALVVGGGLGVSGAVNTGSTITAGGNIVAASGTASTNTTSGALVVGGTGGLGVGGQIYAGGIQNTPIGATTASTGAFTTLTSSGTSIHYGNIVAASGTTSTSNVTGAMVVTGGLGVSGNINVGGPTAYHNITGNLLLGYGSVPSSDVTTLEVNQNSATPVYSTSVVHVSAATGSLGKVTLDSFGSQSYFLARRADGTAAAPSAVQAGESLGGFAARGYGATGYYIGTFGTGMLASAAQNFTDTAQGTQLGFYTVPNNSNNAVLAMTISNLGNVIITSTAGSSGIGQGALIVNGAVSVQQSIYATSMYQGVNQVLSTSSGTGNLTISGNSVSLTTYGPGATTAGSSTSIPVISIDAYGRVSGLTSSSISTSFTVSGTSGTTSVGAGSTLNLAGTYGVTVAVGTEYANIATPQDLRTTAAPIFSGVTSSGNIVANSATTSTSTSTGAIVVSGAGGVGIGGNLYVGGTGIFGSSINYTPANAPIQVGYSINNYSQFTIQNANSGNNASTDIAAVANNGSDNDTYVDMGIVSSGYSQAAYNLYNPNDGYIIVAGNTTTGGGNLILNTYQANDIIFATGGTTTKFEVARITHGNVLVVKSTNNASPAANIGAFNVWGGASITGNTYHGGATVFNGSQTAGNDMILKGANDNTLLWARPNSTYDSVIIGNSATATTAVTGAKLIVNTTDSILLPVGTASQRPTAVTGMLRFNTTSSALEWYNGTAWASASTSFTVIQDQQFVGTGSQTIFTLNSSQTTASCIVSVNGIVQIPTTSYTVSGTTLTFNEAPLTTDVIDVRMLTTTQTVTQLYDTSGYNTVNAITGTGITFTTGTSSLTTQYTITTTGAIASSLSNVTIASASTPTTVDSFYANTYSSAEYLLTSTLGYTKEVTKALVVSNGSVANIAVYGTLNTSGNTLTTWNAVMSGNVVQLQGTTTNASTIIRMTKIYNAV